MCSIVPTSKFNVFEIAASSRGDASRRGQSSARPDPPAIGGEDAQDSKGMEVPRMRLKDLSHANTRRYVKTK